LDWGGGGRVRVLRTNLGGHFEKGEVDRVTGTRAIGGRGRKDQVLREVEEMVPRKNRGAGREGEKVERTPGGMMGVISPKALKLLAQAEKNLLQTKWGGSSGVGKRLRRCAFGEKCV